MKPTQLLAFVAGILMMQCVLNSVRANETPILSDIEFIGGGSLLRFDYSEFNTDNSLLDSETGIIPGFIIGATYHQPDWFAQTTFNYHSGDVDYSGHTQSIYIEYDGLPINSTTNTQIADTTFLLGKSFISPYLYEHTLFGGFGYYKWRRHIQPSNLANGTRVAGILEFYSWFYLVAGVSTPVYSDKQSSVELDFRFTHMLQATLDVDFLGYGGYDGTTLDLGETLGYQLRLPWKYIFDQDKVITVEPYYIYWDIERSNVKTLTRNGVATNSTVVEPRSETRNLGVSIYLSFSL